MVKKSTRILVAEDNRLNLDLVCYMLEKMHYEYSVAENGVQAVEKFKEDNFSLILMDCHMSPMDGFEATRQIRQIEDEASDGRRVPILALTANAIIGDRQKCLEMDMDDYLSKPFKFQQLHNLVEKWLAPQDQSSAIEAKEETVSEQTNSDETAVVNLTSIEAIFKDPEQIRRLIQMYIEQSRLYLDDIRSAADNNDLEKLGFTAHALKSSSAYLGISQVVQTCRELENLRYEKDVRPAEQLVSRLADEIAAAVPLLQDHETRLGNKSGGSE